MLRPAKIIVIKSNINIKFINNTKSILPLHSRNASCHRSAPSELESEEAGARLPLRAAAVGISSFSTISTLSQLTNRLETEPAAVVAGLDDNAELKRTFLTDGDDVDSDKERRSGRSRELPRSEDGFRGDIGGGLRKTAAVLCEEVAEW